MLTAFAAEWWGSPEGIGEMGGEGKESGNGTPHPAAHLPLFSPRLRRTIPRNAPALSGIPRFAGSPAFCAPPHYAPSSLVRVSSRPHTAASPCAGSTRLLSLRDCSRKFSILNSQFSILTVSFVGTIILLMLNWRGSRPGSWSRMCVIFSRLFLEMTVRAFVCTVSPPPSTL